jgi:hypothetical protein
MAIDITALYCCLDDFSKLFAEWEAHRLIPSEQTRQRTGKLSRSEMLFIMVLFHLSPFKHFKAFYRYGIGHQYRDCFGDLPRYDRFVSLMPWLFAFLMVLLHSLSGEKTGLYFAASTKLAVCHNRRIHRHKVFDGLAARSRTSMGWFYGLKLHVVINHKGQIVALKITPGNTADSTLLDEMTRHFAGKLYADKGSIGHAFPHTLAAWPAPHHQHSAQHEELSDAAGRHDHAAQALRHRNRPRYPQVRNGPRALTPQVHHERYGSCPLLPRGLRLQARQAFRLPPRQTSRGLSVVGVC